MSFRDRVDAEKNKRFRSVEIDDFGTPFKLRAFQLCSKEEQDRMTEVLTRLAEAESADEDASDYGVPEAEADIREYFAAASDNPDAAREYFADYDLVDLTMALNVYKEDTQVVAAKSRSRARR